MRLRHVPPAYSPLSAGAIGRGLAAAASAGVARRARAEVEQWLAATYRPLGWRWTDSGTSALAIALRLASNGGERAVALPGYGCYDLATACDAAEVPVRLYDVDPATLGPDWESLEGALRAGAGVIVVVHLYGIPVDLDRVAALAGRYGAVVVEDAAQGIGGSWRGKPLGAHGQLAVLSFGRGKGITSGGGGALLVHDPAYTDRLPSLPAGGRGLGGVLKSAVQWLLARPSLYWLPASLPFLGLGETIYRAPHPPLGMAGSAAGILAVTRGLAEAESEARRSAYHRWQSLLVASAGATAMATPAAGVAGALRFPFLATPALYDRLRSASSARLGVSPGYPLPLVDLPGFGARLGPDLPSVEGSRLLARLLVTLPTHSEVGGQDLEAIQTLLRRP